MVPEREAVAAVATSHRPVAESAVEVTAAVRAVAARLKGIRS